MKKYCLLMAIVFTLLSVSGMAAVVRDTAYGNGADTYVTNDDQSAPAFYPDTNHGTDHRLRAFRAFDGTRIKIGYIRFDISGVAGDLSGAYLSFDATWTNQSAGKSVDVYGVINGPGDIWEETEITYNTAAGLIPSPPTELNQYGIDAEEAVFLGTMMTVGTADGPYPIRFHTDPATLDLTSFLQEANNGLVTFFFIGSDDETEVASRQNTTEDILFPTLTMPNAYEVSQAYDPEPGLYQTVPPMTTTQLSWTNPDPNLPGGVITCDVYFGDTEPNAFLPGYGLPLLASDFDGNTVNLPELEQFKEYYWVVNVRDTSREPQLERGILWSFNTFNAPPVVDAGEDQYVWLTKAVVDTTSNADTYIRDGTPRGDREYMDVRGASGWGFRGYLQFDLSALAAMGPGRLENAVLTLTTVGGASRNDAVVAERFALYGLNDVAGNTPQNWSEASLTLDNVGQEWTFPIDLDSGRLTNLDHTVEGITETIDGGGGIGSKIIISGEPLDNFIKSRIDDNGRVTFVLSNPATNDRGYGIGTKENSDPDARPVLTLTYVPDSAENEGNAIVRLNGEVTDDGLPYGTLDYLWTQVSGPVDVVIDPNDILDPQIELSAVGYYVFQLEADDGQLTDSDTVQVYVGFDACDAAQNMPGYTPLISDLNNDCFVTIADFAILASEWLGCTSLDCP